MLKEKYLLIDTNIYVQCCALELIEGDDINVLKELHTLLNKNKLKLLLPEIVQLELYKVLDNKMRDLEGVINGYKERFNKDNELDERIRKELTDNLSSLLEDRKENSKEVMGELEKIFSHKNTIKKELLLTSEIFINAFKYFLHQSKPYNIKEPGPIQGDCLMMETVKNYLSNKKEYILYFCSDNTSDFTEESTGSVKKIYGIPRSIKEQFKKIEYYKNLLGLLKKVFKIKISPESISKFDEQLKILVQKELQKNVEDSEKNFKDSSNKFILFGEDTSVTNLPISSSIDEGSVSIPTVQKNKLKNEKNKMKKTK
jgi:hypothetical protein